MKRILSPYIRTITAALIVCAAVASAAFAQDANSWSPNTSPLPAPTGMVNDFAGVMDEATKQQLETKLREFKNRTNPPVELAVAIVRTTGDRPIFDYSLAVARGWGIGAKQDDNPSALLFVAIDDRKYFTQVSRDLEDELPDALAGTLQRQNLVPEFRQGNYAKGISDTIDAYIRTIDQRTSGGAAEPTPEGGLQQRRRGGVSQSLYSTFCCLAVILIIALIIFSNRGGGGGSGRRRGGWGGGFGGGGSALPWIIGSVIANAASSSSSSSDWGGGSSWGGDSGGGGWGGFGGGGDFGGGGAGGDW